MIIGKIVSIPLTLIKFQIKLICSVISIPFNVINIFLQSLLYFVSGKNAKLKYFPFGIGMSSSKKCVSIGSLSNEIWFDVLAFIKFHEAPNLFLVNLDLLPICQEYFFSGNIEKKRRNVRDLLMIQSVRGELLIYDFWQQFKTLSIPEIDPPNVFKSFGHIIIIGDSCKKFAFKVISKFQALISDEHRIQFGCEYFYFYIVNINDKQQFNWEEQCLLLHLNLNASNILIQIGRIVTEHVIGKFNNCLPIQFVNKKSLFEKDSQQENSKLIYFWLNAGSGKIRRVLRVYYDGKKALGLAIQIAKYFELAYSDKKTVKKMNMIIKVPFHNYVPEPEYEQKIYNSHGNHLATLRSHNSSSEHETMWIPAYVFFTI